MMKIKVDSSKKVFDVVVKGSLSAQELTDYLNELKDEIKKVNPKEYAFIIDAREQKTLTPDASAVLEQCLKLYADTPFRKRFAVVLESAIAMLQVKKAGKDSVELFTMVTSIEEAYKQI